MKLYNFDFGPYPQRVNIYLAEKGLTDVEREYLEAPTGKTKWPPDEVAAHSQTGSLPIIVDDDGTVVAQSLAILEYLEDIRPEPDMRGRTAAERARTRQLVAVFDEALDGFALWGKYGSDLGGYDKHDYRQVFNIGAQKYVQKLRLAERMIADTEFLAGNRVTIVDCVAMAMLQYTKDFFDVPLPPDCPKLVRWYMRFSKRPGCKSGVFPSEQHEIGRGLMRQTGVTFAEL